MKKFLLYFSLGIILFAGEINENLLYIEAKLYPKIMMLTNSLNSKNHIRVAIVSNTQDIQIAKKYKKFFPKNKKFIIKIIKKIKLSFDIYIFTYQPQKTEIKNLIKNKKIIFTILPNNVQNAMFGIYIGIKVYPFINPFLLKEANIRINPIIFKVGKIYEK